MEQINVKRGRGRPLKYSTEEERIEAIRKNKANYRAKQRGENQIIIRGRPKMYFTEEEKKQAKTRCMLNKEWCCDVCDGHKLHPCRKALSFKNNEAHQKCHRKNE